MSFPAHKGFPVEGYVPSTAKKGVYTLGPHAVNWAWRGSHPQAMCPQLRTERSPFSGCVPSGAHRGVLTRSVCALKNTQKAPCSRARRPQLRSTVVPPLRCAPLTADRGIPTHGQVPSSTHGSISTRGPWATTGHGGIPTCTMQTLENAHTGPNSWPDILSCT